MGLKQLTPKKAYSSDFDDVLQDFYIPALKESSEYCRLAGFFSSTSIAVAAKGIMGLIMNGGTMKLVVSPKLNKEDLDVILRSKQDPAKYIEKKFLSELSDLKNDFIRDHVSALGWLIANNKLEIKVAVAFSDVGEPLICDDVYARGIFHQKVGILKDSELNTISFSGSINETGTGWLSNVEEFKVFCDWVDAENEYVKADVEKFERFWNNTSQRVTVYEIPHAVKAKLIDIAPKNLEKIQLEKYYKTKKKKRIALYQHQIEALNAWYENNMIGLFEMATGTGKTYAALGCVEKAARKNKSIVILISCPFQHLVQQWKKEIDKFGIRYDKLIIIDSSNPKWKNEFADAMIDVSLDYKKCVIGITTHTTFTSKNFMGIIQKNKSASKLFLIADEVHGLGSKKRKFGLIDEYDIRLGLSATPKRWFDEVGTQEIYDYFQDVVYEFGLEKAINTINPDTGKTYLVPYRYELRFTSLTLEELKDYSNKTKRIAKLWNNAAYEDEKREFLQTLMFARANIVKNAQEKYYELEKILDNLNEPIKWAIIYCSPNQIDNVMRILSKRGIIAHRFTMKEGTNPSGKFGGLSERDFLLDQFAKGKYQILVAMKCLDEGVDIPPARISILMSSSGNPREYIQRIGRVIRRFPGKDKATVYDIVVIPNLENTSPDLEKVERSILEKELGRYEEIARFAINNAQVLSLISNTKMKME